MRGFATFSIDLFGMAILLFFAVKFGAGEHLRTETTLSLQNTHPAQVVCPNPNDFIFCGERGGQNRREAKKSVLCGFPDDELTITLRVKHCSLVCETGTCGHTEYSGSRISCHNDETCERSVFVSSHTLCWDNSCQDSVFEDSVVRCDGEESCKRAKFDICSCCDGKGCPPNLQGCDTFGNRKTCHTCPANPTCHKEHEEEGQFLFFLKSLVPKWEACAIVSMTIALFMVAFQRQRPLVTAKRIASSESGEGTSAQVL